jgi:hypothetical protein
MSFDIFYFCQSALIWAGMTGFTFSNIKPETITKINTAPSLGESGPAIMKILDYRFFSMLLVFLFSFAFSVDVFAESEGLKKDWRLVKNKNDIKVYMKHTENTKLKTFKGVTEFEVEEPLKFATVLNDYDFLATLLHLVSSLEETERASDIDRDLKIKTFLPWPVKNRDMAVNVKINQDPETYNVFVDVKDIKDKYPHEKGYIRMPYMDALLSIELLEDKKVRLTYRAILDPGGYVPAILVNIMMKDAPYYTLVRMKRVLQGEAYAGGKEPYIVYPETW